MLSALFYRVCYPILLSFGWLLSILLGAEPLEVSRGRFRLLRAPLPPACTGRRIWVHAASLGEVELALACTQKLCSLSSEPLHFLFTCNTASGLELAWQRKKAGDLAHLAPPDYAWCIRRTITRYKIEALIVIESERWPNLLYYNARAHQRVCLINARMSEQSLRRYRHLPQFLLNRVVGSIGLLLAEDHQSCQSYQSLGERNFRVGSMQAYFTGNCKFPEMTVPVSSENIEQIRKLCSLSTEDFVCVGGSVQPEEMAHLCEALERIKTQIPRARLLLVPRHIEKRHEFEKIFAQLGASFDCVSWETPATTAGSTPIVLLCEYGILRDCYALANCAFVGGSLCDRGGQNVIEPISVQTPTCTGHLAHNFRSLIRTFEKVGAIRVVHNAEEIAGFMREVHQNRAAAVETMIAGGSHALAANADALHKSAEHILAFLGILGQRKS